MLCPKKNELMEDRREREEKKKKRKGEKKKRKEKILFTSLYLFFQLVKHT